MTSMIGGIILFVLMLLNVLLGHRIIKADRKVHIIIGWVILVLGIMHGISGISATMGWGQ
jgi:hypothetical protein